MKKSLSKKYSIQWFITIALVSSIARPTIALAEMVGYVPIGLQTWWSPLDTPAGPESEHLHFDMKFPVSAGVNGVPRLSGIIPLELTVTVHHALAGSTLTTTRIHEGRGKTFRTINWNKALGTAVNETFSMSVEIDTRLATYDGFQEFRFFTKIVRPDGSILGLSSLLQAYLQNGKTVSHYRSSSYHNAAAGWYSDFGYQYAFFRDPWPRTPVSGIWSPLIATGKSGDARPTDRMQVFLDPKNHFHDPGILIRDSAGAFSGRVPIDTRNLANGMHRLVIIAHESDDDAAGGGTMSGVLVVPFEVNN